MTDKHQEIMARHDQAYTSSLDVRENGADDLLFSRVTQWDETLDFVGTEYRGQFDLLRKEKRRLISEMRANPVSVEYRPNDGADPDAADILNGMYRTDMRSNRSKEAVDVAVNDQIDCGFGAWRLGTEYVSRDDDMDTRQVIYRMPIHEANNTVFFDPNSKRMDKSDAAWASILTNYTKEAFEELAKEHGFEDSLPANFGTPVSSYVYPWSYGGTAKHVTVGEYYERKKRKERILILEHPAQGRAVYKRSELKEVLDDMFDLGWRVIGEKTREIYEVSKYLVSGADILKGPIRIVGKHIPIVPLYGEWAFVEGVETWEGITRLAKDPQRLYNMQMSFLADIAAKGPRRKPIFSPEQVQGYEFMWEDPNKYPYYLNNRKSASGEELPVGPMGYVEPEAVPPAMGAVLELTRRSVEDVTSPGMPQNVMDPQASGKAILAVQSRIDNQSFIFMDNLATAMRRDGEIYASMAQEIYDTPRDVTLTGLDGTESQMTVMEEIQDYATGQTVTLNDISRGRFDVYVDVGPSFRSQKQQARGELLQMMATIQDPAMLRVVQLQYMSMMEGSQMSMLREAANKELLKLGVKEPENDKEEAYLQQIQQQAQQPDPTALATQQALEAQAMKDQAMGQKYQADAVRSVADAERAQAQTAEILAKTTETELNNAMRLAQALRGNVAQALQ